MEMTTDVAAAISCSEKTPRTSSSASLATSMEPHRLTCSTSPSSEVLSDAQPTIQTTNRGLIRMAMESLIFLILPPSGRTSAANGYRSSPPLRGVFRRLLAGPREHSRSEGRTTELRHESGGVQVARCANRRNTYNGVSWA